MSASRIVLNRERKKCQHSFFSWMCSVVDCVSWVFQAFIITQRWRPLRTTTTTMMMMAVMMMLTVLVVLMMMTGDAKWGQPENDADAASAAGWAYVGTGTGDGTGKCDGPENSTEQKASAAGPTKAVGVICWSSLLSLPLYPSHFPQLPRQLLSRSWLLLLFRHPGRWHWHHPQTRYHSAAWRSASASAAARRVVIHPRGTVVSAAHNR